MIVAYHKNNRITEVISADNTQISFVKNKSIAFGLIQLAERFPESKIVWCDQSQKEQLNVLEIENLFHHKKLLLSYNPSTVAFIDENIGYIDTSLFAQINKKVAFPTWQMSGNVGGIHSEVLLALNNKIPFDEDFDYFLCSLAKLSMPEGLLCYSEPRLLKTKTESKGVSIKRSPYIFFRFVKQHYRMRWVFFLLFNVFIYERKFFFLPFVFSLFYKNRNKLNISLECIKVQSSRKVIDKATIDVIIPTIGRKNYLYDVLEDLKRQTHLPINVIIVEQNPNKGSESELDYLSKEEWPFIIKHTFTHKAGACNARNIALEQINSKWVFLADDDIRIDDSFIQKTLEKINDFGVEAVTLKCFQKGENPTLSTIFQWGTFGSGCSFVLGESLKNCNFKMGYEFGFGEDGDFGMQLRNQGHDVLYFPEPEILHLKAPIGGFRTKPGLLWDNDNVQPKPSPTVMLYQILHCSRQQINSYKTTLFFKYYRLQKIKNPFGYLNNFKKQWEQSLYWANELKKQNEI